MTSRRDVKRLYDELSPAEAFGALCFAIAEKDGKTAEELKNARPSHAVVTRRSELTNWIDGFTALTREFDRELRVAIAAFKGASVAQVVAQLFAQYATDAGPRMYLSGVLAASGDPDLPEHQDKAKEIFENTLNGTQPSLDDLREVQSARRQHAADIVHGFDRLCQSAGMNPNVVARAFSAVEAEDLVELRKTPPSEHVEAWFMCLAEILLDHLDDEDLPELAAA